MTRARRIDTRRGYTFVELLMSLSILAIGVSGIVAMQKVTLNSNRHARNLALASQISQAWLEQLRVDAAAWNSPTAANPAASDLAADTHWLSALGSAAGTTTGWFRPAWQGSREFGPGFDILGRPVNTSVTANNAFVRFCTHIRLSWLYRDTGSGLANQGSMIGNGLIRAEVRVFWLRDGQTENVAGNLCGGSTPVATIGAATERYHFVYNVSAVRQNTATQ
jgi:type IV pilus assembly protein PilV